MFSEVSSEPVLPTRSLNSPYPYALGYPESLSSKNLEEWTVVVKTSLGDENNASNVFQLILGKIKALVVLKRKGISVMEHISISNHSSKT